MKTVLFVLIFLSISLNAYSAAELRGSAEDLKNLIHPSEKLVIISGDASETAFSDAAIISLAITTKSKLLSDAIAANESINNEIQVTLQRVGIPADDIQNSNFSSSPQFGFFGNKIASFEVINRMSITIKQTSQLKELASVADQYVEVDWIDTSFVHTKKAEFERKVKAKALNNILLQKAEYENALGVKLTPVGIRDSNIRQQPTRGAVMIEEVIVIGAEEANKSNAGFGGARQKSASFDEVKYEALLAIDFKIEPN